MENSESLCTFFGKKGSSSYYSWVGGNFFMLTQTTILNLILLRWRFSLTLGFPPSPYPLIPPSFSLARCLPVSLELGEFFLPILSGNEDYYFCFNWHCVWRSITRREQLPAIYAYDRGLIQSFTFALLLAIIQLQKTRYHLFAWPMGELQQPIFYLLTRKKSRQWVKGYCYFPFTSEFSGHNLFSLLQMFSSVFYGEDNGTPLQYSCLENPMGRGAWWAAVHGVAKSQTRLSNFTFTFYFHALEKEMATHSSVLAWRIPGTGEPGGLPSMGSHRVGHE